MCKWWVGVVIQSHSMCQRLKFNPCNLVLLPCQGSGSVKISASSQKISGSLENWGAEIKCHIYGTPWHSVLMNSLYFCHLNVVYLIVSFCWFSVNLTWLNFFFPNVRDDKLPYSFQVLLGTLMVCVLSMLSWPLFWFPLCLWIWVLLEFSDLILLSVFLSSAPLSTYFLFYFQGQRLGVFCVFSSVCCSSSTPSGFDWAIVYYCFLSLCWKQ